MTYYSWCYSMHIFSSFESQKYCIISVSLFGHLWYLLHHWQLHPKANNSLKYLIRCFQLCLEKLSFASVITQSQPQHFYLKTPFVPPFANLHAYEPPRLQHSYLYCSVFPAHGIKSATSSSCTVFHSSHNILLLILMVPNLTPSLGHSDNHHTYNLGSYL